MCFIMVLPISHDTPLRLGFDKIESDFSLMMSCLAEVLTKFGKAQFVPILPVVGDPSRIVSLEKEAYADAVEILSLAFQILNVVEQHATYWFRERVSQEQGPQGVSGSFAEAFSLLRKSGVSWEKIVSVWQGLSLQLVFTAHPTESRRTSLLAQLRQFFTDLRIADGDPVQRRTLILKNIEALLGTGEFLYEKPSVATERDFVTSTICNTLPDALDLVLVDAHKAFLALGCPENVLPSPIRFPKIGFRSWVASDRDGHPYVTAGETDISVTRNRVVALGVLSKILRDLADTLALSAHRLVVPARLRALTDSDEPWKDLCLRLVSELPDSTTDRLLTIMGLIVDTLREAGAYFLALEAERVYFKVETFRGYLVAQDIRQNAATYTAAVAWILTQSGLPGDAYLTWGDAAKCRFIQKELRSPRPFLPADFALAGPAKDAIESFRLIAREGADSGAFGNIIVSMTTCSSDLLQVLLLVREAGLLDYSHSVPRCPIPIVPLIETVADHRNVIKTLKGFLDNPIIKNSLYFLSSVFSDSVGGLGGGPILRIMCGHSDGGKDAGIVGNFRLMLDTRAKIAAFLAKRGILPVFFEGVGGTLIRGAAPIKYLISNSLPAVQIAGFEYTEQGQIIAQNHLVPFMSAWTMQNALSALLLHDLLPSRRGMPKWFSEATTCASETYQNLVRRQDFTAFFSEATPLDLLEFSRMGSRPIRRTGVDTLSDLRAIPFALCQSQSRFNITGWYGVGTMLHHLERTNPKAFRILCTRLRSYPRIQFVLTNAEMSLRSASLRWMRAYAQLSTDGTRDVIMALIESEYVLTDRMLLRVFGSSFADRRPRLFRTIQKRDAMLDVLHGIQIEALTQWRALHRAENPESSKWLMTGLMTINAISNGLRGTG